MICNMLNKNICRNTKEKGGEKVKIGRLKDKYLLKIQNIERRKLR